MEIRQLKAGNSDAVIIWKNVGETPLEALERFRAWRGDDFLKVPMTYAGRLDPMAEGELLILSGDECKKKDEYLKFDKEYEVEIVFGFETDTYDALGLAKMSPVSPCESDGILRHFPVVIKQTYPPYSSKTVDGRQLHELARAGELPEPHDMPSQTVTIYSTKVLEKGTITAVELLQRIESGIALVTGDFRQQEILENWRQLLSYYSLKFEVIKICVQCSSGTYMRSLAHELGREKGTGAFVLHIKRTRIIDKPAK